MTNNITLKYIADVQNAITPEDAGNWYVNIKECTIQTKGDISTEPTQITYVANSYLFLFDNMTYTITPNITITGLPAFCTTDLFAFHDSSMISYACKQQMLRNLLDYFKTRNIHLLVGDYMTILQYAGLGNFYYTITDQWITDQKKTIRNWIDTEYGTSIRYVEQVEDAIRIAVCNAHLTENAHTAITEIEYRKLIAGTYQYVRTYDTWFGLVYKPLKEVLPDESPIIFCDSEGNAVTDVEYSKSDKDTYTEIWYDKGTKRYPIRHFEQIQPSCDFRWRQTRGLSKCINANATIKEYENVEEDYKKYGFESIDYVLFMYKAILSNLKLEEISSMVNSIRENPDDYLRTDLFIIYNELENLYSCLLEFFNLQITVEGSKKLSAYQLLENTYQKGEIPEDIWNSIDRTQQYITKWHYPLRSKLYNNSSWYSELRTTEERANFWNETYNTLPTGYPLPEANLTTLKNGYANYFQDGIKWVDLKYAQIFKSWAEQRVEIEQRSADYCIDMGDILSTIIESQLQCPYSVLYQLEPYLDIRVLQPIQTFMTNLGTTATGRYSTAFLRDDLIRYLSAFNGIIAGNIIRDQFIIQDPALISIKGLNLSVSIDLSLTLAEMYHLYPKYSEEHNSNILLFNVIDYKICLCSSSNYKVKQSVLIKGSTYVTRFMETEQTMSSGSTLTKEIVVKNMVWNIISPSQYHEFTLPTELTKEAYEPFMYRVISTQFSVLEQIRTIAKDCVKYLFGISTQSWNFSINIYGLEWYLFEDLYNVWKVGTTFLANETLINNWLLTNIETISSWYPNITSDVFTYGRIVDNTIKPNYSVFQRELNNIIRKDGAKFVIYGGRSIVPEKSKEKRQIWNNFLSTCEINNLYQLRKLTNIRDYSTFPSFIYWINGDIKKETTITKYMTMSSTKMSTTDTNNYETVNYELIQ